jgi:ABC-type transport system involved in multi-copper enzyme maturation permease subunit
MLLWKSWFDLRQGFYWASAILLLLLALIVALYPLLSSQHPTDPLAQRELHRLTHDFTYYMNSQWFWSNCGTAMYLISILMSLTGVPAEKKGGVLLMTLSLPVKRSNWVLAHAALTCLLILVLECASYFGASLGGLLIGKYYPLNSAWPILGGWLLCFPWIGLGLLCNSFLRSFMKSALILIVACQIGPALLRYLAPALYKWSPWQLSVSGAWVQGIPWTPILICLFIGASGIGLTAWRFASEEC